MLPGIVASGGFSPLELPNLVGWWDFSDASTVTLNGSDVSQIDDKSGSGHHVSQPTASEQPTYITAGQNGLNTADFNAADNNWLKTSGSESWSVGSGNFYLAIGVEADTNFTNACAFVLGGGLWQGFMPSDGSGKPRIWDGIAFHQWTSLSTGINTPYTIEYWRDGTSIRCRVNKIIDSDTNTSSGTFSSNQQLRVGAQGVGSFDMDGELFEVIFCDDLPSSTQRDACADYLISKWGI